MVHLQDAYRGEDLQIWGVVAYVFNEKSWTADKEWFFNFDVKEGANKLSQ
jgi:hypothetical protein